MRPSMSKGMSPNEKELLQYFKQVDGTNAVTMSKKMTLSIDYTQTLCDNLAAKGFLVKIAKAKYPVFCIPENKEKVEERIKKKIEVEREVFETSKTEVKCALCKGTGKDRWGLMSVLSKCQVCRGKGTVRIAEPYIECPVCSGTGVQYNKRLHCMACKGKGVVPVQKDMILCPECQGSGRDAMNLYCLKCKGTGKVSKRTRTEAKKTRTKAQSATK